MSYSCTSVMTEINLFNRPHIKQRNKAQQATATGFLLVHINEGTAAENHH